MQTNGNTQNDENGNCIVDAALPDFVNFDYLKNCGIEQLQSLVGEVWSNYNDSDPGVTILDQLCYALTELGYCAQFPIADVLTQANKKIQYHDQFFEPQEILTTSPLTIDDYRRLIQDNVLDVRVAYIVPEKITQSSTDKTNVTSASVSASRTLLSGRYQTYLHIQQGPTTSNAEALLQQVHVLLNQNRNLAEYFLMPVLLTPQKIVLEGSIVLMSGVDPAQVYAQIMETLQNFTAPLPKRSGYQELVQQGYSADQIFNGPKMQHGWICGSDALGSKCADVSLYQIYSLIASVSGVAYVESVTFSPQSMSTTGDTMNIPIPTDAIAMIEFNPEFAFWQNGAIVSTTKNSNDNGSERFLQVLQSRHEATSIEANVVMAPPLPTGKYRDIEKYYSIQNTFPVQFNIGQNSPQASAPKHTIALSRQLKGYLMPFDQLLANAFSQLAHIGALFSFVPRHAPAQKLPPAKPDYRPVNVVGIPLKRFSTTYYCQPLYQVIDVKPMLAGHDAFCYQFSTITNKQLLERAEWKAYQEFPFNAYRYGLLKTMESDREANQRRDTMLNHLMARHGESGVGYNDIINVSQWAGGEVQTRIVVKSIWMQNFQKLSYWRAHAFDCLSATRISLPVSVAAASHHFSISSKDDLSGQLPLKEQESPCLCDGGEGEHDCIEQTPFDFSMRRRKSEWVDGELNQQHIYDEARLCKTEFTQFSTFEMKADILLGLPRYFSSLANKLQSLANDVAFDSWAAAEHDTGAIFSLADSDLRVKRGVPGTQSSTAQNDQVFLGQQHLLDIAWTNPQGPKRSEYLAYAQQLSWLATERKGMILIEPILLLPETSLTAANAPYFLSAFVLLPDYVSLLHQADFQQGLAMLQSMHWPAHVKFCSSMRGFDWLNSLIPNFVWWSNGLGAPDHAKFADRLVNLLKLPGPQGVTHV